MSDLTAPATASRPDDSALTRLPATEMARLVRAGELDPVELLDAHLGRIAAADAETGAFVAVLADSARREAEALRTHPHLDTLPLAGVPVAVKDNVPIAGQPMRHGSRATPATPSDADDELVRRLRAAGAVVVGRTAMPELAIWPFTEWSDGRATRNPLDPTRTVGGSSGGSAAAVAAGMAALAVGSDGGGSIRIPAACCGLVGMKPAPGLVPVAGDSDDHWYGLTAFGPLARSVADAALALDVLAGSTAHRDPMPPGRRLRVAVSAKHPIAGARLSRDVRDVLDATARRLQHSRHDVVRANPPYPATPIPFAGRWLGGIAEDADGLDASLLEPRTRAMARRGQSLRRRARPVAESRYGVRAREFLEGFDVLLAPVLASTPPRIGRWQGRGWVTTMLGVARWTGYAQPWNLAGVAALALPAGTGRDGLPIAVQLVAPAGAEPLLLRLAAELAAGAPELHAG